MIKADWEIRIELEKNPEFQKTWGEYQMLSDKLTKLLRNFHPEEMKRCELEERKRGAKEKIDALICQYRKEYPEA
ncbi:MAG: hypothetical protein Q7K44_00060 [Candidatus Liptonbacteria bacterium]|nr:hypothetical protein [Candidatus Liptonbacteria bacterium]